MKILKYVIFSISILVAVSLLLTNAALAVKKITDNSSRLQPIPEQALPNVSGSINYSPAQKNQVQPQNQQDQNQTQNSQSPSGLEAAAQKDFQSAANAETKLRWSLIGIIALLIGAAIAALRMYRRSKKQKPQ